uniref:Holocytochrome c-type synthase n=1 Tax=Heterosigma akashiwo TaxID=2829 RepID=A0A7S3Y2G6_HETAK
MTKEIAQKEAEVAGGEPARRCPMRKLAFWQKKKDEGAKCPVHDDEKQQQHAPIVTADAPHNQINKCPVDHERNNNSDSDSSKCPVKDEKARSGFVNSMAKQKYTNPNVYNVYSQKIDPTNNMPAKPDQEMVEGQQIPLSTERVQSNIPKGGTDSTWLYPSPQMFYNSLARKNKLGEMAPEDAGVVVAIHNNMNENTWGKVLEWERLHESEYAGRAGAEPHLLRFLGRPHDLSPKAMFRRLLGFPEPFDRHDWVVDRGGKEVRYVIDYYHDEALSEQDKTPGLTDKDSVKSILVDVRPALDSVESAVDRFFMMPYQRRFGTNSFTPMDYLPSKTMKAAAAAQAAEKQREAAAAAAAGGDGDGADAAADALRHRVEERCRGCKDALRLCDVEGKGNCEKEAIKLTLCVANMLDECKSNAANFTSVLNNEKSSETSVTQAYDAMQECMEKVMMGSNNKA